jgi:hypothetical protein
VQFFDRSRRFFNHGPSTGVQRDPRKSRPVY